ncbi:MAG: hypothetical protein ABSF45_06915 [Terriglobia bacterium]|jgi:opacity protein-like surface antigen
MKKLIATAALLLVVPVVASAQNADHPYRAEAYGFAAYTSTGAAGGGGFEVFVDKGFGLGGEFVRASMPIGDRFDNSEIDSVAEIMVSANAFYGLPSTNKNRFEPFVTGGLTRFDLPNIGGVAIGGNIGGGANAWLAKHVALRLEFRATHGGRSLSAGNYYPITYAAPENVASFRIGVTFR